LGVDVVDALVAAVEQPCDGLAERAASRMASAVPSMRRSPKRPKARSPPNHPAARYAMPMPTATSGVPQRHRDAPRGCRSSRIEDLLDQRVEVAGQGERQREGGQVPATFDRHYLYTDVKCP
jgi:hypothetical protein